MQSEFGGRLVLPDRRASYAAVEGGTMSGKLSPRRRHAQSCSDGVTAGEGSPELHPTSFNSTNRSQRRTSGTHSPTRKSPTTPPVGRYSTSSRLSPQASDQFQGLAASSSTTSVPKRTGTSGNPDVFHEGFVEKTTKYTRSWTTRYLRLENLEVSYSEGRDTKVKGTMTLMDVERFAEAARHASDSLDYFGLILLGDQKQRWVIRCHDNKSFAKWYEKIRMALSNAGLMEPLNRGLPDLDPRFQLPFASVPLKDLSRFTELEQTAFYLFAHVEFDIPLVTNGPADAVIIVGDNAVYLCDAEGRVIRCIVFQRLAKLCFTRSKEQGTVLGLSVLRPDPDVVVKFFHQTDVDEFIKVVGKIYEYTVANDDTGDSDLLPGQLPVLHVTRSAFQEFETLPAAGHKLLVLQSTQKKELAAYLAEIEEEAEYDDELPPPAEVESQLRSPPPPQAMRIKRVDSTAAGSSSQGNSLDRSPQPTYSDAHPLTHSRVPSTGGGGGQGNTSGGGSHAGTTSHLSPTQSMERGSTGGSRSHSEVGTPSNVALQQNLATLGNHVVHMEVLDGPKNVPAHNTNGSPNQQQQQGTTTTTSRIGGSVGDIGRVPQVDSMHALLTRLKLTQYERSFIAQGVDYDVLLVASPIHLLQFGVKDPHHRSMLMRAVIDVTQYRLAPPRQYSPPSRTVSPPPRRDETPPPPPPPGGSDGTKQQHGSSGPTSGGGGGARTTTKRRFALPRTMAAASAEYMADPLLSGSFNSDGVLSGSTVVGGLRSPSSGPDDFAGSFRQISFSAPPTSAEMSAPTASMSLLNTSFAMARAGDEEFDYRELSTVSEDSL